MAAKVLQSFPDVDLALLQVAGDDLPSLSLAENPNYSKMSISILLVIH